MRALDYYSKLKWGCLALALLEILAIEIPGARDYAQAPYAGYELGPESANDFNSDYLPPRLISRVKPGSPAERAGLRGGDRIVMIQGIPFEDQERLITLGRPNIGETRSFRVARDGQPLLMAITYEKNPEGYNFRYTAFAIIAFSFLVVGMICVWFYPSSVTSLLFWLGLTGAFVFMHKPYFSSFAARSAFAMLRWFITSLWLAILFHFLLVFPKPKRVVVSRPWLRWAVYASCLLLFLIIAYFTIFPSSLTSRGGVIVNTAFLFIGVYLASAVAAFSHTYLTLLKSERTQGVRIMAIGTALGILPIAFSIMAVIVVPQLRLPGRDHYILTLVLVPLCLGYAIWESMRTAKCE